MMRETWYSLGMGALVCALVAGLTNTVVVAALAGVVAMLAAAWVFTWYLGRPRCAVCGRRVWPWQAHATAVETIQPGVTVTDVDTGKPVPLVSTYVVHSAC